MITEIPKKIWLQIDPKCELPQYEATWCQDKINDTDVLYIKAGRPRKKPQKGKTNGKV